MSGLEATDAAAAAVQTGYRITLEDLRARVHRTEYIRRGVLTVCILRLDNGYWLVGRSAPVDPSNYDQAHGDQAAHDDALRQAWPLLAFATLERRVMPFPEPAP